MSDEEMFDILDRTGQKTGRVAGKREAHERGLWHTGMHLCVTDGAGKVFQQLRGGAPDVRILPDVWDLFFVAGHVPAGEDPLATLRRETEEEVGITFSLEELRANGLVEVSVTRSDYWVKDPKFSAGGYHHRVFDHNFVMRLPDLNLDTLVLEDKKVIDVRKYPVQQLKLDLAQPVNTKGYLQHAHRPIDDAHLYQTVLNGVRELTF